MDVITAKVIAHRKKIIEGNINTAKAKFDSSMSIDDLHDLITWRARNTEIKLVEDMLKDFNGGGGSHKKKADKTDSTKVDSTKSGDSKAWTKPGTTV